MVIEGIHPSLEGLELRDFFHSSLNCCTKFSFIELETPKFDYSLIFHFGKMCKVWTNFLEGFSNEFWLNQKKNLPEGLDIDPF